MNKHIERYQRKNTKMIENQNIEYKCHNPDSCGIRIEESEDNSVNSDAKGCIFEVYYRKGE